MAEAEGAEDKKEPPTKDKSQELEEEKPAAEEKGDMDAKAQEGIGEEEQATEGEKGTVDKAGEEGEGDKEEGDKEEITDAEGKGDKEEDITEAVDKAEESTEVEEGEENVDDKIETSAELEDKGKEAAEAAEGEEVADNIGKGNDKPQEKAAKEKIKISESQKEMIEGIVKELTETAVKEEEETARVESEAEAQPEEEEEDEEESEEEEEIDREACIYDLRTLLLERKPIYTRNLLLQSKLAEYYSKNKMEYAYSTTQAVKEKDKLQKYNNQLLRYDKLKKQEVEERKNGEAELSSLKTKLSDITAKLESDFDMLQSRERELAKGLKYTKTGKAIPERVVEQLLAHQAAKRKDVSRVRINYIKLRNYVAKKEEEKKKLEMVGEGLHLMDYEQLRMENQSIKDKIEERDEELQRLRDKATSSISILAHVKEKSDETNANIQELKDHLEATSQELKEARETANTYKMKHDWLRKEIHRLHQEAGLLVQPKLLRHFEETMESVSELATQLQNLRNSYEDNKRKLVKSKASVKAMKKGKPASNVTNLVTFNKSASKK